MKPKTKLQHQALSLSQQLPPITKKQEAWAHEHCIEHVGRRLKSGAITCIDCGHTWQDKQPDKTCICQSCGRKLTIETTKRHIFRQREYAMLAATRKGFQVLRFFLVDRNGKAGRPAFRQCDEVVQLWITPDGKCIVISRLRALSLLYCDLWSFSSPMEVRPRHSVHDIAPLGILPGSRYIPELKRNGFKGSFYGLTPLTMFTLLLGNPKAETLLKAGQLALFKRASTAHPCELTAHWASIKICLRNGYTVQDVASWYDYLVMLAHFGKDVRNAKYVCPANLKKEHDKLVARRNRQLAKERIEAQKKEMAEADRQYRKDKKKFFGIVLTDGPITVSALKSVHEFIREGEALHHCVFASGYHSKKDSLIMSATVEGKRMETVEVSLNSMEVVQCRGAHNKNTPYHKRILNLVNKNMKLIRQKMAA